MCESEKAEFHKVDLFHTVTLGVAKSYAASSLAILQEVAHGSSIEARLQELTGLYLEFCRDSELHFEVLLSCLIPACGVLPSPSLLSITSPCKELSNLFNSGTPEDQLHPKD